MKTVSSQCLVKQFTMEKRITLKDIAKRTGYGLGTVSMALRNHTKIPAETREKIQRTARELGYRKDPMLSALANYRERNRNRTVWRGGMAAITLDRDWTWTAVPYWEKVLSSMHAAADESGYSLIEYNLDTDNTSLRRHQEILASRGIIGLVLQPTKQFPYDAFDWGPFSVISLGIDLTRRFPTVATDFYSATVRCIQKALEAGYKRLGLILPESMLDSRHYPEIGAFLAHREFIEQAEFFFMKTNPNSLANRQAWIKRHGIDAVISNDHYFTRGPDGNKLPFACINVDDPDSKISGVYHPAEAVGASLIHQLHGLIVRGEKGASKFRTSIHISGVWNEGATLMPEVPIPPD